MLMMPLNTPIHTNAPRHEFKALRIVEYAIAEAGLGSTPTSRDKDAELFSPVLLTSAKPNLANTVAQRANALLAKSRNCPDIVSMLAFLILLISNLLRCYQA